MDGRTDGQGSVVSSSWDVGYSQSMDYDHQGGDGVGVPVEDERESEEVNLSQSLSNYQPFSAGSSLDKPLSSLSVPPSTTVPVSVPPQTKSVMASLFGGLDDGMSASVHTSLSERERDRDNVSVHSTGTHNTGTHSIGTHNTGTHSVAQSTHSAVSHGTHNTHVTHGTHMSHASRGTAGTPVPKSLDDFSSFYGERETAGNTGVTNSARKSASSGLSAFFPATEEYEVEREVESAVSNGEREAESDYQALLRESMGEREGVEEEGLEHEGESGGGQGEGEMISYLAWLEEQQTLSVS